MVFSRYIYKSATEFNIYIKLNQWFLAVLSFGGDDDDELMLNVLRCHETY